MIFLRLCLLVAATTSLSSCSIVTTAPEPPDFKLSAEELGRKYRAMRKTAEGRLYAREIHTVRDAAGQETLLASGGALLVNDTEPPILAQAPSISVTPAFTEVRGMSTLKRQDRLYLGADEFSIIRIDGTDLVLAGQVHIRALAGEDAPPATPEQETPQAAPPPAPKTEPEPAKEKPQAAAAKPKATSAPQAQTTAPPVPPPPAPAKPKVAPPVDRSRLLNLMREPSDR
ncbi:MAG: hypothetical protein B7Z37_06670 [Verrucomicrobia bacterium 12-59-8]|nr:MAG: hypothetical protein B7Z37_06670 [Verrucomicrobia bacterium 12-59-8]